MQKNNRGRVMVEVAEKKIPADLRLSASQEGAPPTEGDETSPRFYNFMISHRCDLSATLAAMQSHSARQIYSSSAGSIKYFDRPTMRPVSTD